MTVLISAGGATAAVWMSVILAAGLAVALRGSRSRSARGRGAGRWRAGDGTHHTDQAVLFAGSDHPTDHHSDSGSSCDSGGDSGGGDSGGGDSGGGDSGGGCD